MNDEQIKKTEAEAIAAIARRGEASIEELEAALPQFTRATVPLFIAPNDKGGVYVSSLKALLDEYRAAPERKTGVATMLRLESLIAHANVHKAPDSALFAFVNGMASPSLTCVYDYHGAAQPRFGEHRARYEFPMSEEWSAWTGANDKAMPQAAFAEFIETHLVDVLAGNKASAGAMRIAETIGCMFADPGRLLELSRGMVVRVNSQIRQQVTLGSGEMQINYDTVHADERGQPLKVPGAFLIGIPVFRGGAPYQIPARLRYRVKEGAISWFYELFGEEKVFEHAFKEACDKAQSDTGLALYFGAPER